MRICTVWHWSVNIWAAYVCVIHFGGVLSIRADTLLVCEYALNVHFLFWITIFSQDKWMSCSSLHEKGPLCWRMLVFSLYLLADYHTRKPRNKKEKKAKKSLHDTRVRLAHFRLRFTSAKTKAGDRPTIFFFACDYTQTNLHFTICWLSV